jgi:CRISPR-associated protein Csb2
VKRLVITATPLIDRWSISGRRDRASWPPSPDTLFSALVAAAASLGDACHPALYWLEEQGTPNIEADASPPMVESVRAYCPVADRAMWDSKSRQARCHNSIGSPKPVSWSWSITDTSQLEALQAIAREVTYVGSSRGPVLVHVSMAETPLAPSALIPMNGGRLRIRGIYPGRLDELEAAFQRGERPKPTIEVPYGCLADLEIKSRWEQMIPLRRSRGPNLHVGRCVPVAEALRQALMSYLPDGASGSLTGHDAGGAVLEKEHLAIVPLAHVQGSYADGDLLGMGLLLPSGLGDAEYDLLIQALGRWLAAGGIVNIGPVRWTMEIAQDAPQKSLRANRFHGWAREWASVTPIVLDRHPRRRLAIEDVVASMCGDAGLPKPDQVEAAELSLFKGGAQISRVYPGQRDYLKKSHMAHLRLGWKREVPGPILLGRGRYFGLGVMLPVKEAA